MKWIILLLLFLWASAGLVEDLPRLLSGIPHVVDYIQGMWPPSLEILPELITPLIETIQIALVGTTLAAVISVPLSFFAAKNSAPNMAVYLSIRGMINFLRAVPTLVWAILFVSMVGLGALAGVFAITIHCIGTLTKYFSETLEAEAEKRDIKEIMESMRTEGASEMQTLQHGLLPSVLPLFISYIIYYLESNIRAATVLGLVGAGGIGLYLTQTIRLFKRHETLTVVLVIFAVVIAVDLASRKLRERFFE